jgi:hypothetical protein
MDKIIINITGVKMTIDRQSPLDLWRPLPGSYGEYFSIHGNYIAGVQAKRISVWLNGELQFEGISSWECCGYPLQIGSKIFWNNNIVDVGSEKPECIDILKELYENTEIPDPAVNVFAGYHPVTFAWSPHADLFLVSEEGQDQSGISTSRVLLIDLEASVRNILWEGNDFAPKAALVTNEYIIFGTRNISIFDLKGNFLTRLPGEQIPQRIHGSQNGEILLIQTYELITIWRTETWVQIGRIKGPWLNAALSPDAKIIYAIDFAGIMYGTTISETDSPMKIIDAPAPLATIDAGEEYLVASFSQGDPVRYAPRRDIDSIINNKQICQ